MKRILLPVVIIMAISITMGTIIGASSEAKDPTTVITNTPAEQANGAADPVVKTVQLTPANAAGNYRFPGVAEDSKGNRLVSFRSTNGREYDYMYCPKDGKWSAPKAIANGDQPALARSLFANIEVDSTDRFHCQWEDSMAKGPVYASFKDGVWTKPFKIPTRGRYDLTSSLAVSSTDEVVTVDCEVLQGSKDIYIHRKPKDSSKFSAPFNLTRDPKQGSTQPCIALDSKDNAWVVWKSDYHVVNDYDNLVIFLGQFLPNNKDGPMDWRIMSPDPGWSFLPQVAVNSEDKVMVISASTKINQYISRLYDPATKKLGDLIPLNIGLNKRPWHMFFSRLGAHGKDFYASVMNEQRVLFLLKYDEAQFRWDKIAQVSTMNVEIWDMYMGYDTILIAWNSMREPSAVYLTTVSVEPFSKFVIKSVSNLKVTNHVERNFFHAYYLNALTWAANPFNTEKAITITAHRIYRKARTEGNSKWMRIAQVAGTVFKYEDRNNISANSDYVYAVTCLDDKDRESNIF
jgi:hypothetical protein